MNSLGNAPHATCVKAASARRNFVNQLGEEGLAGAGLANQQHLGDIAGCAGVAAAVLRQHVLEAGGPGGHGGPLGTLAYQALYELKQQGIGVTTCVGIGGDPVPGTSFIDCLRAFEADPETKAVMMFGEIGGSAEEEAAEFIAEMSKPVVAYIAASPPPGQEDGPRRRHRLQRQGHGAAKMDTCATPVSRWGSTRTEAGDLMAESSQSCRCSKL